jgi:hypothetical protein
MAFPTSPTTEAANKVRQKAYNAVYGNATTSLPNSPFNFYAFKALFLHLAINKGNPDLRFVEVNGLLNSSDGGNSQDQVLVDGPCTLYAIFLRKRGSTETIFKGTNHASTSTTDGTQDIAIAATVAGTVDLIYADGRALSTGLTVCENTTRTGATKTLAANRMDGFIIISQ